MGIFPYRQHRHMDPEDMPPQQNRVLGLSIASVIAIVLVLLGVVLFAQNRTHVSRQPIVSKQQPDQNAAVVSPRMSTINGRLGLTFKGSARSFRQGDKVVLFVYADAQNNQITGYDAVIHYNPKGLTYEAVSSTLEGMEVHTTDNQIKEETRELVITGIRSTSRKDPFIFSNTALVEITFMAQQSGPSQVDVMFEPGSSTDSNIMNVHNQDVLGATEGVTVTVGNL